MSFARTAALLVIPVVIALMAAAPATAQATRTWVSGVGDDNDSCSRTAPCKTLAGAILKTAKDGEINCLDPGGFGTVTITKSVTIDCSGTFGSILAPLDATAVVINITEPADLRKLVRLRGLRINGLSTGTNGVRVLAANTVIIEDTNIESFTGNGIEVNVVSNTVVHVSGTTIDGTNVGVRLQATGAGTSVQSTLKEVQLVRNTTGLQMGSGVLVVSLLDSTITHATTGVDYAAAGAGSSSLLIDGTRLLNNITALEAAPGTTTRIGRSVVANNQTSIALQGGSVISLGTNSLRGNTTNSAPTANELPE